MVRYTMHVAATLQRIRVSDLRFLEIVDGIEVDPAVLDCVDRVIAGVHEATPEAAGLQFLPYTGAYSADVVFAERALELVE